MDDDKKPSGAGLSHAITIEEVLYFFLLMGSFLDKEPTSASKYIKLKPRPRYSSSINVTAISRYRHAKIIS